jgi:hypothetical protein
MSDLARYLAGDNYLTRSASGIKRGLSALADSLTARSNEGIENMGAALSGVRVRPGAILTDAGYVMPDASGQPDFTQVGLEREPDTLRLLELFGSAMTPARGASVAAKSGAGGKVAADVARALPMDEASRMARAAELGFDIPAYHGSPQDLESINRLVPGTIRERRHAITGESRGMNSIGSWLSSRGDEFGASMYAGKNGAVYPVQARIKNPLVIEGDGRKLPDGTDTAFAGFYDLIEKHTKGGGSPWNRDMEPVRQALADQGHDSVILRNTIGDGAQPQDIYIMLNDGNVRSRFAAFDPARADEADLLASRANLGPIVNALLQGYDRR